MTKALTAFLLSLFALTAAACNTVHGAGEDVEETGEAIQDAAD